VSYRGNAVGAQRAEQAKFAAKVAYVSSIALGLFNLVLVFALRPYLGRLISSDEEVIALVAKAVRRQQHATGFLS
jgi:Na+-driven multidrug efflux pump